ncbi:metallophosphoesterase [Picosynechococcus sp. NKBG042902]|uniref:metallophosphoesterase family protein n=1 Tax=Picosynechococcus sp. NKBG042902 TaxID=490193 RepID=UPI0004AA1DE2|nr:metallophosphoesterase [Picosynechococcus sp. NKBG042902]
MHGNRRQFLTYGGLALGSLLISRGIIAKSQAIANPVPTALNTPAPGETRLVVISDLNSAYGSTDYLSQVKRAIALIPDWQPDLVLCAGDMVAGQKSSLTPAQLTAMWQAFERYIAQPLHQANIPFAFTLGNHDASGSLRDGEYAFAADRQAASQYWRNPAHTPTLDFVDRRHFPFYYSFTQNNIFYSVWDASTARISPAQLAWIEASLASDQAQRSRLRFALGHLSLYPVASGSRSEPGNYLHDGDRLQALLEKYNVHTYISGHQHAYYPAHRGQLELLHTGALGDGPRSLVQGNLSPYRSLTMIDIPRGGTNLRYTTYNMDRLTVVDHGTLPGSLNTPRGHLQRRDLRAT